MSSLTGNREFEFPAVGEGLRTALTNTRGFEFPIVSEGGSGDAQSQKLNNSELKVRQLIEQLWDES